MKHRSHISSREAKARGWTHVPSARVRAETRRQGRRKKEVTNVVPKG